MRTGRIVALDTETTGLSPKDGHRVIEIGCAEIIDGRITGNTFQVYINPERDVPMVATRIHGITNDMLRNKPTFKDTAGLFLDFIAGATLVVHNAAFDMGFLNYQLNLIGKPPLDTKTVIDTLLIAKRRFYNSSASLDALCKRFNIDLRNRVKHGALIDAKLLALVYIEMEYNVDKSLIVPTATTKSKSLQKEKDRSYKIHRPSQEELDAHTAFLSRHGIHTA